MKPYTVSYVNIGDLLTELGILSKDDREDLLSFYFDWVTYGDATYTMVSNDQVIDTLVYYWRDWPDTEVSVTEIQQKVAKFWELVSESDYVNMEN